MKPAACLLICGLGIGWLMGLSASPVLSGVLTSLLTVVAGVTSVLAGINFETSNTAEEGAQATKSKVTRIAKAQVNPVPIMVLIIGLVSGAIFGVLARTHELFGADPQSIVNKWKGAGLEEKDIRKRLFESMYPSNPEKPKEDSKDEHPQPTNVSAHSGVLFATPLNECESFRSKKSEDLRHDMESGSDDKVAAFARRCTDVVDLNVAVEELICPTLQMQNAGQGANADVQVTFAVSWADGKLWRSQQGEDLRKAMIGAGDDRVASFARRCMNTADLKVAVEELICPDAVKSR